MKVNHIYNKPVTCLEPGEIVTERYNGSNAKFAIFKTTQIADDTTICFSELKKFEWIDWGDGNVTLDPLEEKVSHKYESANGEKEFVIVVMGVDNFGEGKQINDDPYDIFEGDYIKEAYFGEGTKIWANENSAKGFSNAHNLTTVQNLAQCPIAFFLPDLRSNDFKLIEKLSFNIDCHTIKEWGLSSTRYKFQTLEIPDHITTIETKAFYGIDFGEDKDPYGGDFVHIILPKNIKVLGELCFESSKIKVFYKGTSDDWGKIDTHENIGTEAIFYYSETEPTEVGNYWHYVDGKPTAWEVT